MVFAIRPMRPFGFQISIFIIFFPLLFSSVLTNHVTKTAIVVRMLSYLEIHSQKKREYHVIPHNLSTGIRLYNNTLGLNNSHIKICEKISFEMNI